MEIVMKDKMLKSKTKIIKSIKKPDRLSSYFKADIITLMIITFTGIVYNVGMTASPYFEGRLVQKLYECFDGTATYKDMIILSLIYIFVIITVQSTRAVKRFYTRRFSNNTSRNMRHIIYNSIINKSGQELTSDGLGDMMTRAVSDVDDCAEGMRKFTTEIFDTGVVLISYIVMLIIYDWRLTLISCAFVPIAYIIASRLKVMVTKFNETYKRYAGKLNGMTYDRINNGLTFRVFGREDCQDSTYADFLDEYEKKAVIANMWESTMQPIYNIIAMMGVIPIIYFGSRNIMGAGWTLWNIGAFTTFISCYTKMALKASKSAKLFNSVQKAYVSWKRLKPFMQEYIDNDENENVVDVKMLEFSHVNIKYKDSDEYVLKDVTFSAEKGQIIGVTGVVSCGKSSFGKLFTGETVYTGNVFMDGLQLSDLSEGQISERVSYMGHEPELMSASIKDNILMDKSDTTDVYLKNCELWDEVNIMPDKENTYVGNGGFALSKGQQSRIALARTLCHGKSIYILDDPFSSVDKNTENQLFNNIKAVAKDGIVILISHRLNHFPEMDKVLFLQNHNAFFDTHKNLYEQNHEYATLYQMQTGGGSDDRM